jgi:hypothetical protein
MPSTIPHQSELLPRKPEMRGIVIYLLLAGTIALALSLYFIIKHKAFAFVDIGSDTFFQFYPFQVASARQLREFHELGWSFNVGLGGFPGSDFDPVRLLSAFFPDSWQLGLRLPLYFAKLLVAGAFFLAYLRCIGFAYGVSIIGALGLTFSSYEIVNGQWDENAFVACQFAAYLFFVESFLRSRHRGYAVAAGLTVGLGAGFDLYTFALLSLLYASARLIVSAHPRKVIRVLPLLSIYAALGWLLTAPIQLPNLHYLFDSPRVGGHLPGLAEVLRQFWQVNDPLTLGSEVAGLFGKDLLGTGDAYRGWANYFEGPGFYVGMLPLLCIPQLLGPAATRREKLLCVAALALLLAYFIDPALRYVVYGFGHIAFRLSTLWVSAGLLVLGLAGLRRALESGVWRLGLVCAAGMLAILIGGLALNAASVINVSQIVKVIAFTGLYTAMLWQPATTRLPAFSIVALIAVCAVELTLFSAPAMIERTAVGNNGTSPIGTYDDGTEQALALIRAREGDGSFYRVEKTYNSVFLCDALIQDYHGIKSYYFHGSSVTRFVDSLQLARPVANNVSYIGSATERPLVLDLLGVRYLLSKDRSLDQADGYEYIGSAAGVNVYQNHREHGFAHLYESVVSEAEASARSPAQRDELLLQAVVVENPAAIRQALASAATAGASLAGSSYANLRLTGPASLAGEAHAPGPSVMLISMPFDPGWSAQLDASPLPLFRADYGLTAALVPAGTHALKLSFEVPGRRLGWWLAAGSFAVLLILWLVARRTSPRFAGETARSTT